MAEQQFTVGNKARDLLRYTQRATRIVSEDISRSDSRRIFQKAAELEDVREIKQVCTTAVHALDTKQKEGFTRSTYNLYGRDIRKTAKQILLDAHTANGADFLTDYDERLRKIYAVIAGCSSLLDFITLCTEDGVISLKKAEVWTKKVTDVKYPAMKWLRTERSRAEKLRQDAEEKRLKDLVTALKAALSATQEAPPEKGEASPAPQEKA